VRIGKAAAVFGRMKKVWRNNNISLKVKRRLHEAIILSALLYGAYDTIRYDTIDDLH